MSRLILDFGDDAVRLVSEETGRCVVVDEARLDGGDPGQALARLFSAAKDMGGERAAMTLLLPVSQILFTRVPAPGPTGGQRAAQVLEGLDGMTPYPVSDLVVDWTADGDEAMVAAVTRQTIDEAVAFVTAQGFRVTAISAVPPTDDALAPAFPVPGTEPAANGPRGIEGAVAALRNRVVRPSLETVAARRAMAGAAALAILAGAYALWPESDGAPRLSDDATGIGAVADMALSDAAAVAPAARPDGESVAALSGAGADAPPPRPGTLRAVLPEAPSGAGPSVGRAAPGGPATPGVEGRPALTADADQDMPRAGGAPALTPLTDEAAPTVAATDGTQPDLTIDGSAFDLALGMPEDAPDAPGLSDATAALRQAPTAAAPDVAGPAPALMSSDPDLALPDTGVAALPATEGESVVALAPPPGAAIPDGAERALAPEMLTRAPAATQPDDAVPGDATAPGAIADAVAQDRAAPGTAAPPAETAPTAPDALAALAPASDGIAPTAPAGSLSAESAPDALAAIDPVDRIADTALPAATDTADARPAEPETPLPAGTEVDGRGFVVATEDGATTRSGVRIFAGAPDVAPPLRPGAEVGPERDTGTETAEADAATDTQTDSPADTTPDAGFIADLVAGLVEDDADETPSDAANGTVETAALTPPGDRATQESLSDTSPDTAATPGAITRAAITPDPGAVDRALASTAILPDGPVRAGAAILPDPADGVPVIVADAEEADMRPSRRPPSVQAMAEARAPTDEAVAVSLRPTGRPERLASAVANARVGPAGVATAAAQVSTTRQIPSGGSVSRTATFADAIELGRINLVGVYGSAKNRRALVRLSNGRFVKVQRGDRLDGGQVAQIGETSLSYVKGGRTHRIDVPSL